MLVTRTAHPDFLDDDSAFSPTEHPDIFQKLDDGYFVVALEYVTEEGEDDQYPMEDVLDRFLCHIERFEVEPAVREGGQVDLFANSELARLADAVHQLVGRRAYNVDRTNEEGRAVIGLVIDDSVADARV